ncbi:dipeptidase 1-like [Panulirus ornatus]|uniref:dipeptidase 1-like n=1 Tax=Panulirus ornatus TaxID=150431 RepID=UPI003A8BC222
MLTRRYLRSEAVKHLREPLYEAAEGSYQVHCTNMTTSSCSEAVKHLSEPLYEAAEGSYQVHCINMITSSCSEAVKHLREPLYEAGEGSYQVNDDLVLRHHEQIDCMNQKDDLVLRHHEHIDCMNQKDSQHNDLPWNIRKFMHNKLHSFNFTAELKKLRPWSRSSWSHTDLPRLKEGMVGAQFWVSYVPCQAQRLNAVQLTIEQIDLIKRLIDQYPDDLRLATSADEVEAAFKDGRIASLIGVEGGHAIQNSLGVLRALRDLGVRYLTLTHTCSTPWAECARAQETDLEDPLSPRGLTHFGKTVVREMNRLGLLVDLSHVSQATMQATLEVSRAPVIFSHSSVYAICRNPRNVPDHILRKVAMNGGIVMVSFYNHFLTCSEQATIKDVANHINHVRKIAGIQHVGIGADFDGVNKLPEGLEDVSKYPNLFAELLADSSWSLEDLKLLAGQNLLRVMREAEKVRLAMSRQKVAPYEEEVPTSQLENLTTCSYKFTKDPDDS